MNLTLNFAALGLVLLATVLIGSYGLRISRTTSDFYVASRSVSPWLNASAIGGEYLSAASFLGVAGLVFAQGPAGFWFPIGYTAGYLLLLLFVAAPLRRSGAYTLPDFTARRLDSQTVRRLTSTLVIVIGWLYIVPQLQGAALTLGLATGLPSWTGAVAVAVVVGGVVALGGMRSITFVQAFQYWLKLSAVLVPGLAIAWALWGTPRFDVPALQVAVAVDSGSLVGSWVATGSLVLALLLGTMGLPHVLVRFTTNPDGHAARTTTLIVLVLIGGFYLFPTLLGFAGRAAGVTLDGPFDSLVLVLPAEVFPGFFGQLLTALVLGGAFAAFLSTSSGLAISLAGVVSQEFAGGSVRGFRFAALASTLVPLLFALIVSPGNLAGSIGLVFAFTASTITPVLLLAVWWSRLTARGAIAGMISGGAVAAGMVLVTRVIGVSADSWLVPLNQPALLSVPIAFAVTAVVSLLDPSGPPRVTAAELTRIHTPER